MDKHQAIMDAALATFLERGYAATSLDDIAAAGGVSRQTIYNHFHDKEQLFLAVVAAGLDATLGELRAAAEGLPDPAVEPEQHLLTVARRMAAVFAGPRTAELRVLVQSEAPRHPGVRELWRERTREPAWSPLVGQLALLAHGGRLRIDDPARAAGQFITLVTGTGWRMTEWGTFAPLDAEGPDPEELERALRANVGLFVRGYAP